MGANIGKQEESGAEVMFEVWNGWLGFVLNDAVCDATEDGLCTEAGIKNKKSVPMANVNI